MTTLAKLSCTSSILHNSACQRLIQFFQFFSIWFDSRTFYHFWFQCRTNMRPYVVFAYFPYDFQLITFFSNTHSFLRFQSSHLKIKTIILMTWELVSSYINPITMVSGEMIIRQCSAFSIHSATVSQNFPTFGHLTKRCSIFSNPSLHNLQTPSDFLICFNLFSTGMTP